MISPTLSTDTATSLERFCGGCGYDLRGLSSDRCPECGSTFNAAAPASAIPWLRRHSIGFFRAYGQTLKAVLFTPVKFARDAVAAGEINDDEANRFRLATVALAFVPLIFVWMTAVWSFAPATNYPFWQFILILATGSTTILACLLFTTNIRFIFRGHGLTQEELARGRALSDYACGAVALAGVPSIMACIVAVLEHKRLLVLYHLSLLIFAALAAGSLTLWFTSSIVMLTETTKLASFRQLLVAGMIVAWWTILSAVLITLPLLTWTVGLEAAWRFLTYRY